MALNNGYSNSYLSDFGYRDGDFCLSSVTKSKLDFYNIKMSVREFQEFAKTNGKYKIILTGGGLQYRRTKIYNYYDLQKILLKTKV